MKTKESSSKGSQFQGDRQGVTGKEIKSSSSVVTKEQISNPEQLLTTDSTGADLATEVTVYNNDLSLVKQRRALEFNTGINKVEYTNFAALIDPTSVIFEDTKDKDTAVLEQNYEFDLVSVRSF